VTRHAAHDEEVRQHIDDVGGSQLPINPDAQALPGELIDQVGANAQRLSPGIRNLRPLRVRLSTKS